MKILPSFARGRLALASLFVLGFLPSLAAAAAPLQEEGGDGEAKAPSLLSDIIGNAGVIGWLIIILSVVALALIIEHFMSVKREKLAPPHLIDELEALFDEEKFQDAMEVCEAEPTYLTNVVGAGLSKLGHSFETMTSAIDERANEEDIQLNAKVGWLSVIAAVAPMMGLLGTVNGMVMAFGEIALKPTVKPNDLAAGIKGALITTLLGLIVAIPVTTAYVFFKNRVTMASIEIGAIVEELFERFRTKA